MSNRKKKTKGQQKIDEIAVKAKKVGMSYGQYVALTEYCGYYPKMYVTDPKVKVEN